MFWGIREESKIPKSLTSLGSAWEVTPELFTAIQKFICAIYGSIKKTINEVRFDLFYQKYQNQNKNGSTTMRASLVSPCVPTILLQFEKKKCSKTCPPTYY